MHRLITYASFCWKHIKQHKLHINQVIPKILIALLSIIRPLLGPAYCYFEVSCTKFAKQQLQTQPLHKAIMAIVKRILTCNPLYPLLFNK